MNAATSKKSKKVSALKSAAGSWSLKAVRKAETSKKSSVPSPLRSAAHVILKT